MSTHKFYLLSRFSSPSHWEQQGEWGSGCVVLSCWLGLNHDTRLGCEVWSSLLTGVWMLEMVFLLTASAWVSRESLRAQVVLLCLLNILCLLHDGFTLSCIFLLLVFIPWSWPCAQITDTGGGWWDPTPCGAQLQGEEHLGSHFHSLSA